MKKNGQLLRSAKDFFRDLHFEKAINTYAQIIRSNNQAKGFTVARGVRARPIAIALLHTELSEALEADRCRDEKNFREELADVAIRLLDLAAGQKINLGSEIIRKVRYNVSRPKMHGNKKY